MTTERLREVYQEIQTLGQIPLEVSPEIGPQYLLTQLQECRRQQDRMQTLLVEIHQTVAAAKKAKRAHQAQIMLLKGHPERAEDRYKEEVAFRQAEDTLDDVLALERVLGVIRNNLKTLDSDIRLAARILDTQMRLGIVRPPEARDQPVPSAFAEETRTAPVAGSAEEFYKATEGL